MMNNVKWGMAAWWLSAAFRRVGFSILMVYSIISARGQIYVAQTAQGAGDGSSAVNPQSLAWLNSASNWNNGTIQPGTTIHLVGTLENQLSISGSGTAVSPITVYFEPNAKFSGPYWTGQWWGGGAITVYAQKYIVIDGGSNGVIEATNNGTALGYQTNSCGVGAASASFLTVKNLTVRNMYVRTSTKDENAYAGSSYGVQDICTVAPYYVTAFEVTNCTFTNIFTGIDCDYGAGCSNYTFVGNVAYGCNWGGRCGDRNKASTMTNLVVAGNFFSNFTNWNDTVNDDYHHNGFYGWAESGGVMTGVKCYGNRIGPNFGGAYSTSGLFFSGGVSNVLIYNNLFIENPGDAPANGLVTVGPFTGIYNNTFMGGGSGQAINIGGSGLATIENNLVENCTFILANSIATNFNIYSDYNMCYNIPGGQACSYSRSSSSSFLSFLQWQALGYDAHSSISNPNLNSSYNPQVSSVIIGVGTNLSALFLTDFYQNSRQTNGAWVIGAVSTLAPGLPGVDGAPVILVTPVGQTIGVISVGMSTNGVFTVTNAGSGTLTGTASVSAPYGIVVGGSYNLKAGQNQTVVVSYNPTVVGSNPQVITFSGGSGTNITLNGVAVMPAPQNLQPHAPNP